MWRCILNERLRILKLLEEGKINADEAARLLEALSHSERKYRKEPHRIWAHIETIPERIASAFNHSFTSAFDNAWTKSTMQFPKKKKIEFQGISGDLVITGTVKDTIEIQKDGYAKIKENDNKLGIKALSGAIKISAPHNTDFEIKGISGDLRISNLMGTIKITSVSGDITGEELSGTFIGDFVSGDVNLDYQKVEKIKIISKSGDIILKLDEKVETEIEVKTEDGDITCDFDLKNEEKKDNWLKGIINKPKTTIEIKNEHGDVKIKKRS